MNIIKNIFYRFIKNKSIKSLGFYSICLYILLNFYKRKSNIFNYIIKLFYSISFLKKKINKELKNSSISIENELITKYKNFNKIPEYPYSKNSLNRKIKSMKNNKFFKDKISGIIYHGEVNHINKLNDVFNQFSITNPLHPDLFPSIRNMEIDIINMMINLFKGDENCCGNMTYGGTESILLACLTYRDYFKNKKNIKNPNIVCVESIHPAFDKAGHYFGIELIKLKEGENNFEKYINSNTILLVGSAPSYAHGLIDPIKKMSKIAKKYKIGFHVDSCMGGFLIPYISEYNYINFKLEGLTSISVDTHKYGYSLKGSSVLLFKNIETKKFQHYINKNWNGGVYATPTLMGSKSGGLIASSWASLLYIGNINYKKYANEIRKNLLLIKNKFADNKDIKVIGNPDLNIIAFKSENLNIYSIISNMKKKGWNLTVMQYPASFHLCLTKLHTHNVCINFCNQLQLSINEVKKNKDDKLEGTLSLYGSSQMLKSSFFIDEIIHDFIFLLSRNKISNRYKI